MVLGILAGLAVLGLLAFKTSAPASGTAQNTLGIGTVIVTAPGVKDIVADSPAPFQNFPPASQVAIAGVVTISNPVAMAPVPAPGSGSGSGGGTGTGGPLSFFTDAGAGGTGGGIGKVSGGGLIA